MKAAHRPTESFRPSVGTIMNSRLTGRTATAVGGLRVAAVSRDPEKVRQLRELLVTDDGAIELEIWPIDWPAGSTQLAVLIERQHPNMLLLDAPVGMGDDFSALERIAARYPEMAVLLVGVRQQPAFVLAAMEKRMHQLSCIKWRSCG